MSDDPFDGAGWTLTPEQRELFRRRLSQIDRQLVQQPEPGWDKLNKGKSKINGIPIDVLLMLASMEELAQKGNRVARRMVEKIRRDWNITGKMMLAPGVKAVNAPEVKPPLFTMHLAPDEVKKQVDG